MFMAISLVVAVSFTLQLPSFAVTATIEIHKVSIRACNRQNCLLYETKLPTIFFQINDMRLKIELLLASNFVVFAVYFKTY